MYYLCTYVGITNPSSTQKCTTVQDADGAPDTPPTGVETATTGYTALSLSDNSRLITAGSNTKYPCQIYSVVVPAWTNNVLLSFKFTWEGQFLTVEAGKAFASSGKIYIYNNSTSTWELVSSVTTPADKSDTTVTSTKTNDNTNYIKSGVIYFCAIHDAQTEGTSYVASLRTDFVQFEFWQGEVQII